MLSLYDAQGHLVANTGPLTNTSVKHLLQQAYQGQTVSGLERFYYGPNDVRLAYLSVSPIFGGQRQNKVTGVLLVGQALRHERSLQEFAQILPD